MKYCIIIISIVVIALSCKTKQVTTEIQPQQAEVQIEKPAVIVTADNMLCSHKWTHAREQSTDGSALYLNDEGNTFPPSRFRNSFEFNPDGTCRYMFLSPTDRHQMVDGTYVLDDDLLTIRTIDGTNYGMFTITKLSTQELVLKPRKNNQ